MGKVSEEREFSAWGRDRLIRLILGLRKERDAAYIQNRILKTAVDDYHKKLDEMVELVAEMKKADSKRLEDGILLKGRQCTACGVWNSFEKERRSACRTCGLALK